MSARARALLDEFARDGWTAAFVAGFHALLDEARDEVSALVVEGLDRGLANAHFLGEAVSYLPPDAVPAVVERALAAHARDPEDETAADVVAHVALEFPRLLHPHLARLFEQGVNAEAYYSDHPWRESGDLHHPYLLRVIRAGGEGAREALNCLLETRTPAAFETLLRHPDLLRYGSADDYLAEVGHERAEPAASGSAWSAAASLLGRLGGKTPGGWRRLYPEASYHVRFPDSYLDGIDPPNQLRHRHPTWRLEPGDAPPRRFGGDGECACGICGRATQRLMVLDPVPAGLGVTGMERLTLELCLPCMVSNETLEYVHDAAGRPSPHRRQVPGGEPDAAPIPLRATEVRLVPTPARWYWQDWAISNSRQNLTRLGGHPAWIQGATYPTCPDCERTMAFLLGLDATLPAEGGEESVFDEGAFYGFWCDGCRVSAFLFQQT